MEMKLEVARSVAMQRRKPCSRFAWLLEGHGSDISSGLFLLDNTRVSQLCLATGKTRRSFPSLSEVQSQLALTHSSHSGSVMVGLTVHGHMFTWLHPSLQLAIYATPLSTPSPHLEDLKGCHLFVSDSGEQALLVTNQLHLHLWELREGLYSEWWQLQTPDDINLPHTGTRQAAVDASFYVHQVLGECCECHIIFTKQETGETTIARCLLTWKQRSHTPDSDVNFSQGCSEGKVHGTKLQGSTKVCSPLLDRTNLDHTAANMTYQADTHSQPLTFSKSKPATSSDTQCIPVNVTWKTCTVLKTNSLHAPCGRGCYVARLSPTSRVSAVAINHDSASDTHVLFIDLLNEVSVSSPLYTNRTDIMTGRTFWVTSLAWSGDGLLLAAMTRRGCLVLLPRFGPPLKLVTTGCGLDMGPSRFLPLHPLITVQNKSGLNITDHETSESSERDALRQRFSVACHPYLPLVLCSDGYCLTVLKLNPAYCMLPRLVCSLVNTGCSVLGIQSLGNDQTSGKDEYVGVSQCFEQEDSIQNELDRVASKEDGFTSTLTMPSSGYFPTQLETGKICFAGMDDSHGLSQTKNLGQVSEHEKELLARAHLLAAWGLLLSASGFQPGNGTYPSRLSPNNIKSLSSEMNVASNLAVTALTTFTLNKRDHHKQREFAFSALSLAYLDLLDQRCHKMVYKLANTYMMSLLSQLLHEHKRFASSSSHTKFSIETYSQSITSNLQNFWAVFQKVVTLVMGLYSHPASESQRVFSLPLLVLQRVSNILTNDLHKCTMLSQKMLSCNQEWMSSVRENDFLRGCVAKHVDDAVIFLDSVKNAVTTYFNHNPTTRAVLTGCSTTHSASSIAGNVDHVHRQLLVLPRMLQTCQLKQALALIYSPIVQSSDSMQDIPACHISVPGISLIPPAALCGLNGAHPHFNIMLLTLARFMGAFCCSKTTGIVCCTIPQSSSAAPQLYGQHIEVESKSIALSVCEQSLSNNWTPTHAVELFLLSGQWYEAAKLAAKMGDRKKGLMLCIVCIAITRNLPEEPESSSEFDKVEQFAQWLAIGEVLRVFGLSRTNKVIHLAVQTPPDLPYISSILSVCGHVGMTMVGSEVSFLLLQKMWRAIGSLPMRVSQDIHLPAPPLYCPQPTLDEGILWGLEELQIRQNLSQLIQSFLSLLQACNSLHLCHYWYTCALVELHSHPGEHNTHRHMPNTDGSIRPIVIPASLKDIITGHVSIHELSYSEQYQLATFRELCGLLWLLHVRDVASHHLRQAFHSKKTNVTVADQTTHTPDCALWCARLLPLQNCFHHDDQSDIEDTLLSVLLELPCNQLTATLLAQHFPDTQNFGPRKRNLKLKMDQLLARMRTAGTDRDGHSMSQPLSVDYQLMSKAVLEGQCSNICEYFSPQCVRSDDRGHKLTLSDKALEVGSYPFEYDQAYIDLLNTLFSITLKSKRAVPSSETYIHLPSYHHHISPNTAPSHGELMQHSTRMHTQIDFSDDLQTMISSLYKWIHSSESTVDPEHKHSNSTSTPTMTIGISLSFLTYCLQLEEEKYRRASTTESHVHVASTSSLELVAANTQSDGGGEESLTTVTPVLDGSPSSMTTITPLIDHSSLSDSTLHAEDLTITPSKHPHQMVIDEHILEELKSSSLHFGHHPLPLLQMPDTISMNFTETTSPTPPPADSDSALLVALSLTSDDGDATATSDTLCQSHPDSSVQLGSGLGLDFTDSQSTGELPSQVTFSIGEVGSSANPNGTAEISPPLQTDLFDGCGSSSRGDSTHIEHKPPGGNGEHPQPIGELSPCSGEHIPHNSGERPQPSEEHTKPSEEYSPLNGPHSGEHRPPGAEHPLSSQECSTLSATIPQHDVEQPSPSVDHPPSTDCTPACVGHTTQSVMQPLPHHTTSTGNDESVASGHDTGHTGQEIQLTLSGYGGGNGEDVDERDNEGEFHARDEGGDVDTGRSRDSGSEGVDMQIVGGRGRSEYGDDGGGGETNIMGGDEQEGAREDEGESGRSGGGVGDDGREWTVGCDGEGGGVGEDVQNRKTDNEIVAGNDIVLSRQGTTSQAPSRDKVQNTPPQLPSDGSAPQDDVHHFTPSPTTQVSVQAITTSVTRDRPLSEDTDIGKIVRSEMKKFLQAQHQQLMMMLDTSSSGQQIADRETAPPLNTTSNTGSQPTPTQQRHTAHSTSAVSVNQSPDGREANTDSLPQGQSSLSSDLSIRHLRHEDTTPHLPAATPSMTTPLPLLHVHIPSHHTVTQPQGHLSHTQCVITEEKHGYTANFPLLQLDAHEDAITRQYDNAIISKKGGIQSPPLSIDRQSEVTLGSLPLLTLDHTGEEVAPQLPSIVLLAPQLRTVTIAPEHITLPRIHGHPPDPAPVELMSVGRSITGATTTTQTPSYQPNSAAAVTQVTPVGQVPLVAAPPPLLVPAAAKLPPILPLPTLVPTTQPQPIHLLPVNEILDNPSLKLLHIENHVHGIAQGSMTLLQLPDQPNTSMDQLNVNIHVSHSSAKQPSKNQCSAYESLPGADQDLHRVPQNSQSVTDENCSSSHSETKRSQQRRNAQTTPSLLPPVSDDVIISSFSNTPHTKEHAHERDPCEHSQGPSADTETAVHVPTTTSTQKILTCERLEIRRINMQATYLPNDHSEVVPVLDNNTELQLTPRTSSESEGTSLDQPSGQTPDSPVQTVTSVASPKHVSVRSDEVIGRQFIRIADIDTDEGSTPPSSGDEGSVASEVHLCLVSQTVDEARAQEEEGSQHEVMQALGVGEREGGGGGRGGKGGGETMGVTNEEKHMQHPPQPLNLQNESPPSDDNCSEETGGGARVARAVARREVLSQLQQLECQLTAIETTARTVEGELLASNQLLGTIDELQTVSKPTYKPTLKPPHTLQPCDVQQHQIPTDLLTDVCDGHSNGSNMQPDQANTILQGQAATQDSKTQPVTMAPYLCCSAPLRTTPTTTPALHSPPPPPPPPPLPHLRLPHHVTVPMSTSTTWRTHSTSGVHGVQSGRRIHGVQSGRTHATNGVHGVQSGRRTHSTSGVHGMENERKTLREQHHVHFNNDKRSLLSERSSKQTLRKWVAAKKRERTTSSTESHSTAFHSQQMALGKLGDPGPRRLQSQEQIKSRRMTDALSLMEDILSAEPPPIHTSTHCPSSPRHTKRTPQPRHYSTTKRQPGRGRKNVHTSDSVLLFPTTQHDDSIQPALRYCSSTEGLTTQEQIRMAHIMASTELSSVSSGSVASHIDWDLVDQLIDK